MLFPSSSRRQSGVVVVWQFVHRKASIGPDLASAKVLLDVDEGVGKDESVYEEDVGVSTTSAFTLLYVGHPEHSDDPPVPLHRPWPGHEPATGSSMVQAVADVFAPASESGTFVEADRIEGAASTDVDVFAPVGSDRRGFFI